MINGEMKLFAWQPKGHGQDSFFVMAASEDDARHAVNAFIKSRAGDNKYSAEFLSPGWGTDYYPLTVLSPGEVIANAND